MKNSLINPRTVTATLLAGFALATAGVSEDAHAASVDQDTVCEVSQWQHDAVAAVCKPGQKVVFLPARFGDAQLPILFAAVNCDLRYGIALTEGGVTCIYYPMKSSHSGAKK